MALKVESLAVSDVKLVTPDRFGDDRGFFSETYNAERFKAAGIPADFVQDNHSLSAKKGTVRGLHCCAAPSSTLQWMSAKARRPMANGSARS